MKRLLFFLAILFLLLPGSPAESQSPGFSPAKRKAWYLPKGIGEKSIDTGTRIDIGPLGTTPSAGKGRVPSPEPAQVESIKLLFQTGIIPESGTATGGKFLFDLGPDANYSDLSTHLRIRFKPGSPPGLTLVQGAYEEITITDDSPLLDSGGKRPSQMFYPNDFYDFRFASDPMERVDDPWFLQGVEVQIKLAGAESYISIYRNPCVGRKIGMEEGRNLYSPHARLQDIAFCFYFETGTSDNGGTEETIYVRLEREQRYPDESAPYIDFSPETLAWINDYHPGEFPRIVFYGEESPYIEVPLHYAGFNDFERGGRASYTFTVHQGKRRIPWTAPFRVRIDRGDAWLFHRLRAYNLFPGSDSYLEPGISFQCAFDEYFPNVWLSRDPEVGHEFWPESDYQRMDRIVSCPSLRSIQITPEGPLAFGVLDEG